MRALFERVSERTSKMVTTTYSTSFSLGILLLNKALRQHIYAIYGYVRFADEIVDTFHEQDKESLLEDFRNQTYDAIDRGISLNPVINSFQKTALEFGIGRDLIDAFLYSMSMDIEDQEYDSDKYNEYIYGSAEVVGLMCLKVFTEGDPDRYEELKYGARKLGAAFQKINFLRDLNADYNHLGRIYFPGVNMDEFNDVVKAEIEKDIEKDFHDGLQGILELPKKARFGTYLAYVYYHNLFKKIKRTSAQVVLEERVRLPNRNKYGLLLSSYLKHSFNLL